MNRAGALLHLAVREGEFAHRCSRQPESARVFADLIQEQSAAAGQLKPSHELRNGAHERRHVPRSGENPARLPLRTRIQPGRARRGGCEAAILGAHGLGVRQVWDIETPMESRRRIRSWPISTPYPNASQERRSESMEPPSGIEPETCGLRNRRSTN